MNEAETCRRYVVPRLVAAGWDTGPRPFTQQDSFTDGRIVVAGGTATRAPQKRTDYLPRYTRDFPLAVVEAKAADKTPPPASSRRRTTPSSSASNSPTRPTGRGSSSSTTRPARSARSTPPPRPTSYGRGCGARDHSARRRRGSC